MHANTVVLLNNGRHAPAVLCYAVLCRSVGFSGTILRSNLHESKQLVLQPDVRRAVEGEGLIIWPWVSAAASLLIFSGLTYEHCWCAGPVGRSIEGLALF